MKLIDKDALVAEIEKLQLCTMDEHMNYYSAEAQGEYNALSKLESFLDTLEVKDPYEQCVQYDSIKAGIQAHAETYSFNIESKLFNQLTKEQQKLWREEIEQACISGGNVGVELARDLRYKENLEVKEMDLEKLLTGFMGRYAHENSGEYPSAIDIAKHFFELGLKAQKGE